jgi:hypothetical protein
MSSYWFKPKTYGYGATPSNWKGWVATGLFVIVVLALSLAVLGTEPTHGNGFRIGVWVVTVAGLTLGFVWLSRAKTGGQWGWRWGK